MKITAKKWLYAAIISLPLVFIGMNSQGFLEPVPEEIIDDFTTNRSCEEISTGVYKLRTANAGKCSDSVPGAGRAPAS